MSSARTPVGPGETHPARATAISIAAAVGGFLFGFDTSVINGAVESINDRFTLGPFASGFVVGIALIGSAIGAWFAGQLADKLGRPRVMLIGAVLFLVSSIGSGIAFEAWDLALWRFVGGLGIGIASVIGPTYISEVAPAHLRGRLASLQQMAIVIGIFVSQLSNNWLQSINDSASADLWLGLEAWRWMFLVGVIPSLVYGILSIGIPESPRFLVAQGKDSAAEKVLARVLGETPAKIQQRVADIRQSLHREDKPSLRDLKGPRLGLHPLVWVGILLAAFQQLVGINVIFYFSNTLWQAVGFDESQSFLISVIGSVTNVLVTVVAILLVDRVGRRPLLLVGSIGMFLSLATMALAFSQAVITTGADGKEVVSLPGAWAGIALVAANLFIVFFGGSWGPVMWVLLGEMFPNRIRAKAMAIATASNWIFNFIVTETFQPLADVSLTVAYGLYAAFALLSFFFVLAKIPETKGKELEDMTLDTHVRTPKQSRT
ncbi:sugar porter family MFS transporter [Nakamurella leprariae]|uniref:Sugar porter family MFS transporter n=1 Tax=Nakamurella leprariae TaxID=2803911 RepID=A0A939BYT5_9ACTN|nr:sugar porter family MFS transporter [Nakamurella leprariae]MBM9467425.1 sugar porter family MFS transporter [Nakamurella leprariae]